MINDLQPTIMFDYVGGDVPAKAFEMMPPKSHLYIIRSMSGASIPVNAGNVLFTLKELHGMHVY